MDFQEAMGWVEEDHVFPKEPGAFHSKRFDWLLRETGLALDLRSVPLAVVAGSCGKASTARFLAHIAARAGLRVVLGTKPPLQETPEGNLERYQVSGPGGFRWLSPEEFRERVAELRPAVTRLHLEKPELGLPAPYELRAWILARTAVVQGAGLAVVEANMGLRLDPAGALPAPEVTLLTPVGTDHGALLKPPEGYRPELGERSGPFWHKVGGVHPDSPLVVGRQDPGVQAALPRADRLFGQHFDYFEARCTLSGSQAFLRLGGEVRPIRLITPGAFQLENAAHAAAAADVLHSRGLLPGLREAFWTAVQEGLAVTETPGRMQVLARRPAVILAVATSPEKLEGLLASLDHLLPASGRLYVCATFLDRIHRLSEAVRTVLAFPRTRQLLVTRFLDDEVNRDLDPETLGGLERIEPVATPREAMDRALKEAGAEDLILLLGNGMAAALASGALTIPAARCGHRHPPDPGGW
jgi:dihydrofolate synthase/folylpolyglutamate synthase